MNILGCFAGRSKKCCLMGKKIVMRYAGTT